MPTNSKTMKLMPLTCDFNCTTNDPVHIAVLRTGDYITPLHAQVNFMKYYGNEIVVSLCHLYIPA